MREDCIVFKGVAVCRFCGTLLSRDVESVPACKCRQIEINKGKIISAPFSEKIIQEEQL